MNDQTDSDRAVRREKDSVNFHLTKQVSQILIHPTNFTSQQ